MGDEAVLDFTGSDPQLASYTGRTVPPSIISSGSTMLVRFVSNAAGESGKGFEAAYQAVCEAGFTWDTVSAASPRANRASAASAVGGARQQRPARCRQGRGVRRQRPDGGRYGRES